jgi:hypothetical protein
MLCLYNPTELACMQLDVTYRCNIYICIHYVYRLLVLCLYSSHVSFCLTWLYANMFGESINELNWIELKLAHNSSTNTLEISLTSCVLCISAFISSRTLLILDRTTTSIFTRTNFSKYVPWVLIDWLFTVLRPTQYWRIFHLYGDVTITGEGLKIFGLCSTLRAFEQGKIFIVPHLLWQGTSVFPVSSKGPPYSVTFYDTQGGVEDSILIRILTGPHSVASSDTRGCGGPILTLIFTGGPGCETDRTCFTCKSGHFGTNTELIVPGLNVNRISWLVTDAKDFMVM